MLFFRRGTVLIALLMGSMVQPATVHAELRWGDLNAERTVITADWLRLKLDVLGLRLSYPAYRVSLEMGDEPVILFTFVASGGMAKHLTEETSREQAEEAIAYHARGIRDQIEELIEREFPALSATFDAKRDIRGLFMGPGKEWSDPPRMIGEWRDDAYAWSP